jgi:hypothetical protein
VVLSKALGRFGPCGSRIPWHEGRPEPGTMGGAVLCPQNCLSKQQVLTTIRQLQQLLKGQETRFAEGIRNMKTRLAALQNSVSRVAPDAPPGGSPNQHCWCHRSTHKYLPSTLTHSAATSRTSELYLPQPISQRGSGFSGTKTCSSIRPPLVLGWDGRVSCQG